MPCCRPRLQRDTRNARTHARTLKGTFNYVFFILQYLVTESFKNEGLFDRNRSMINIIFYFFIKGTEVNVLFCPLSRPPNRGEKSGCESPKSGCRGIKFCRGGGHHGPPDGTGPNLGCCPPGMNPARGIWGALGICSSIGGGPRCMGAGGGLTLCILYCSGPPRKNRRSISTTAPAPSPNLNFSRASFP